MYLSKNAVELQLLCRKGDVPFEIPHFKNIERWDYKRYVLFVDSYSENDLKISAFFSHKNVDNKGPFWAGFHTVIYKQQDIIPRLTKILKFGRNYFQKMCHKWNDNFEIQKKITFVVR